MGAHTNRRPQGSPGGCGEPRRCCVTQSGPAWSCQPRLKESDATHMAPAGLHGAARLRVPEELAGINQRIPSSSCSPKSAAGNITSRGGLSLAAPCHAPCSCWQVQLGSDLLGSHQPSSVLSNSHQKYWQ